MTTIICVFLLTESIFLGKSFGVGVILATAFIHMLVPSLEKLASPCLGYVWHKAYPAFGGLFAMCTILIMQLLEYCASNELEHHFKHLDELQLHSTSPFYNRPATAAAVVCDHQSIDQATIVEGYLSHPYSNTTIPAPSLSIPNQNTDRHHPFNTCPAHNRLSNQLDEIKDRKRWLNTIVLEFGILTHSVIIGITLGVSPESEFVGLLVAICFHQFFEGNKNHRGNRHTQWDELMCILKDLH